MGLVIARLVLALLLMLAARMGARADAEASSVGRRAFDAGVDAALRGAWSEAARAFEASLNEADRLATRFNLVLVHAELDQLLEVRTRAGSERPIRHRISQRGKGLHVDA